MSTAEYSREYYRKNRDRLLKQMRERQSSIGNAKEDPERLETAATYLRAYQ